MPRYVFSVSNKRDIIFVGSSSGFYVISLSKFKKVEKKVLGGGIGLISGVGNTNVLALVGGWENPFSKNNIVLFWNDMTNKVIGGLTFEERVIGVCPRPDYTVVLRAAFVCIYRTADLSPIRQYNIQLHWHSSRLACSLISTSVYPNRLVVAFPGISMGQIRLEIPATGTRSYIQAFQTHLQHILLSDDGRLVSVCSEEGTIVKIYDVSTENLVKELKIVSGSLKISCIAFSPNSQLFAVCTYNKMVYLYNVGIISSESPSTSISVKSFAGIECEEIASFVTFDQRRNRLHLGSKEGFLWSISFSLDGSTNIIFRSSVNAHQNGQGE